MLTLSLGAGKAADAAKGQEAQPILLIVMDPLAKELACACVSGYGQRDYRKLAAWLKTALQQEVSIEFSDDLADSLKWAGNGQEVMVIGEQLSVARSASAIPLKCEPVCELTGLDGSTTLKALFVARSDDPVKGLEDIAGRELLFGLPEADGKYAAAQAALRAAGVQPSQAPEKRGSYSEAALDLLDSRASPLPVAVIPGYALRLLEGCGSITPGDLKIIGSTQPVPFITVFLSANLPSEKRKKIVDALLAIKGDPTMLKTMESLHGFTEIRGPKSSADAGAGWPDWRGPHRDGRVPRLPARLPDTPQIVWKKASMNRGLAGLSVSGERLILAERDFGDEHDVYRCLNTKNGETFWRAEFPARGNLDYGQSPRATPVIHENRAYLLGAFGDMRCVSAATGEVLWQRHLPREFQAELPTWGMCSSPLVVDDLIIVNPGGAQASLVALDRLTGSTRWTAPGPPAAYAAFICGEFGGRRQIVGYDRESLGGWAPRTGERLWRLIPPMKGDFNVPTPIAFDDSLLVSTENNGTRLYRFDGSGHIIPQPAAVCTDLAPDTATPIAVAGRLFGAHMGLRALDVQAGLQPVWCRDDDTIGDFATLLADAERVLVITVSGELILLDALADQCVIISRVKVFDDDVEVYSHPALVGSRLYLRGGFNVMCLELGDDAI